MVKLIPYQEKDLLDIHLWHTDNGMELKLGLARRPTLEDTRELIEDPRGIVKMIDHDGQIIGYIRYAGICWEHGFCEFHTLVREFLGTRVCVEVIDQVLDHAFNNMGMNHVSTFVIGNNMKLAKTALKYGFKQEGTLRQLIKTSSGERYDYHIFGMLKHEFKPRG